MLGRESRELQKAHLQDFAPAGTRKKTSRRREMVSISIDLYVYRGAGLVRLTELSGNADAPLWAQTLNEALKLRRLTMCLRLRAMNQILHDGIRVDEIMQA